MATPSRSWWLPAVVGVANLAGIPAGLVLLVRFGGRCGGAEGCRMAGFLGLLTTAAVFIAGAAAAFLATQVFRRRIRPHRIEYPPEMILEALLGYLLVGIIAVGVGEAIPWVPIGYYLLGPPIAVWLRLRHAESAASRSGG